MPKEGVIKQHRRRIREDADYREAALTPPGNHSPGGHVDDDQRIASGEAARDLPGEGGRK